MMRAGALAARLDQRRQIVPHLVARLDAAREVDAAKAEAGDQRLIPADEAVLVRAREPEHVRDHADRELVRELLHQLDLATA
jgi:chorismate mutase